MQRWLATNSPERNVILLLSRQAAKKTTQFSKQESANISILTKTYFHLKFTLGWFRLPPSPPWLDGLLAVSLISTLVVGLLRVVLRALLPL